jgi:hypothetical protein
VRARGVDGRSERSTRPAGCVQRRLQPGARPVCEAHRTGLNTPWVHSHRGTDRRLGLPGDTAQAVLPGVDPHSQRLPLPKRIRPTQTFR